MITEKLVRAVEAPGTRQMDQPLVVTDTDIDGLSGLVIAMETFRELGVVPRIYAHFQGQSVSQQPGTNAASFDIDAVLNYLGWDGNHIVTVDIPPPREVSRRAKTLDTIRRLASLGVMVEVYDVFDHADEQHWRQLRATGAVLHLYASGYDTKLGLPLQWLGKYSEDMAKWSLVGSAADFDENIASKVSRNEEEFIASVVDPVYKSLMQQEAGQLYSVQRYGSAGVVAMYVLERLGGDIDAFYRWAQELYSRLSPNQRIPTNLPHKTVGDVVVVDYSTGPSGLAWKTAWYYSYYYQLPVAVVYNVQTPRGSSIIVAAYWRMKSMVASHIDAVVQEITQRLGTTQVGHPGARSVNLPPGTNGEEIARQIAEQLNQRIQMPRVSRFINDQDVAAALRQDYTRILQMLAQILQQQQELYREYLELKKKQVSLLEQMSQQSQAQSQQRARAD